MNARARQAREVRRADLELWIEAGLSHYREQRKGR
jgi:hypothetical protein